MLANRIFSMFIFPNLKANLKMVEGHLATSGGDYICGPQLTSADILVSFPLIAAEPALDGFGTFKNGSWKEEFPKVAAYVQMIQNEPGYKKSAEKIIEIDGKFKAL
jgi:glutathione S-transferase